MKEDIVVALLNPIGRAMAIRKMDSSIRTSLLKLAFMSRGDECADEVSEIGDTLAVIGIALDNDPKLDRSNPKHRIIAGAVSACAEMIKSNRFDPGQLTALEVGGGAAMEMIRVVQPKILVAAALQFQRSTGRKLDVRLRGAH
jgi:hypothetical protein